MIKELVDNLVIILKSTETKKFVHKSGENIATMCLNKDILSGEKQIADEVMIYAKAYAGSDCTVCRSC